MYVFIHDGQIIPFSFLNSTNDRSGTTSDFDIHRTITTDMKNGKNGNTSAKGKTREEVCDVNFFPLLLYTYGLAKQESPQFN